LRNALLFGGGTGVAGIDLFDRFHGLMEDIKIELLKLGMGRCLRNVVSVLERLDLKACGLLRGKSTCLFYFALELVQRMTIGRNVGASYFLKTKYSITRLSKSSPPRWVAPVVAKTSKSLYGRCHVLM